MLAAELLALDASLMRLRRIWAVPPASEPEVPDGSGRVELSTVLVIEACTRDGAGPTTVADVGVFAGVAPSTASRFVRRAAEAGMVTRHQDGGDGRRAVVEPTAAGRALFERARALRLDRLTSALSGWTDAEVVVFVGLLARFAEAAVDPARGAPLVPPTGEVDDEARVDV